MKFGTILLKGTLIGGVCAICLIAPITLPVFAVASIISGSKSYMLAPFIILDLKTIVTFIVES